MNREILFRAKRKDNGEWVEGFLFKQQLESDVWCIGVNAISANDFSEIYGRNVDWFIIDPYTLCQYTGLTDKKGRKIWENDIVDIASEDGYFLCEWDDDAARYVLNGDGLTVDFENYYGYECEVVGNVFDDGELLEVE